MKISNLKYDTFCKGKSKEGNSPNIPSAGKICDTKAGKARENISQEGAADATYGRDNDETLHVTDVTGR